MPLPASDLTRELSLWGADRKASTTSSPGPALNSESNGLSVRAAWWYASSSGRGVASNGTHP